MSVYKRGRYYSFNFLWHGRKIQASTRMTNRNDARDAEAAARLRLSRGVWDLDAEPVADPSIKELFDALEADFRLRGKWSVKQKSNFKCVRRMFPADRRASTITSADVRNYIAKKQRKKRKPATINRHLLLLSQAFRLARLTSPEIPHLSEAGNARRGFFERTEFDAVCVNLPADLSDFALFAFLTGWRKSECASITWQDVEGDLIRLRGENAKNGEARSVVIAGELKDLIERRKKARRVRGRFALYVFHRDGQRVAEFRKSWASACTSAKVPGRLFHDLRRSSVRHMIRSGVPQNVAMKISGHKTASMFRRYDICNEDDLRTAMESVQKYHEAAAAKVVAIGE